ncbi:MAG TPA: hypothetical protein VFL57_17270, partial [Bryobacteraceae bacterium]|nr:hypothetical protein [Bryobacteraceae bacterium]
MKKQLLAAALSAATLYVPAQAVETKFWTEREQADFEKGKLTNLSLRSDGRLMLAPTFRELFDSSVPYLWTLASDSKGNLYAGGGGPSASAARVFRIDAGGKAAPFAELPGMEVHAIAINRRDQVFAASAPDGKVYRIGSDGKAEAFYDPKTKYIWGMVFAPSGDLFIATGDKGEVHRVSPEGNGGIFFRTEETHARSITVDSQGNVIVGTEPGGLILRISPAGEGFVLYQAPKREITAVAIGGDGVVYAAGVGNKGVGGVLPPTFNFPAPEPVPSRPPATTPPTQGPKPPATATPAPLPAATSREASVSGGSELYRIERDNYVRRVWSQPQDIVYAIGIDAQGRPVIGTGNKGNIYRIDSENTSTLLINSTPTQVTAFTSSPDGTLHAATGNIGRVYRIGPGTEAEGGFESEPFDVGGFSWWGRLSFHGEANGGKLGFETRSGNLDRPQKNWSNWAPVDLANGARVSSPAARFLQYRVNVRAAPDGRSPQVSEIEIAYMAKNVAPIVEAIELTPPNYRTQPPALTATPATQSITLPAIGQRRRTLPSPPFEPGGGSLTLQYAKGSMGARWAASDPNNDELIYKLEIRGTHESTWKLLRDKVRERHLTWDSTAYPDGEYVLRITASDAPDNPPDQALSA